MTDALLELAAAGGTAIVSAAATDFWQSTKGSVARLFGRGDDRDEQRVSVQLERIPLELDQVSGPQQERIRTALQGRWTEKLAELLEENPELEDDLRALVEAVRAAVPIPQQSYVQTNNAYGSATQNITQTGDIVVGTKPRNQ
ncbi:hypothetical protein [Kitasatospora paracochleata]|uniref:Uncharacterized protein n=1 Tax=Kitasatospora paracochleata TaxID=58354 RepID=A0ABT1JAR5_9ACTN|nr:hypothetical protein [Kitasatospora paracochleata]MCP2314146.1 hypothetical protein [Kitasatospora paracochleata]